MIESFRWALTVLTTAASCGCGGGGDTVSPESHKDPGSIEVVATATYLKCPRIDSYTVSPVVNVAGLDVTLVASVSSAEVVPSVSWTASSGTLRSADTSMAVYRCGEEAAPTVTLTVSAADCRDSTTLVLDCT